MASTPISGDAAPVTPTPFNPTDWLQRFRAVGGWWIPAEDGKPFIGWKIEGYTSEQNDLARAIWHEVDHDPTKCKAVSECAVWEALLANYCTIEALSGDDVTDEAVDLAGVLVGQLLATPAPHNDALKRKLDYLLDADDEGATGAYSSAYIRQTVADYRRILGEL